MFSFITKFILLEFLFFNVQFSFLNAKVITVGLTAGYDYSSLSQAADNTSAGDTILVFEGTFSGTQWISELNGSSDNWISIIAADSGKVIFSGGTEAWHLSDVSYIYISGFIYEQQTGNGVNIDDAGTFDTPSHNLIIENCTWRSMNASGNNDELKLSGLDNFIIRNSTFMNGSNGGSLIDMVGCHNGIIESNYFENAGSNCIQAKGGTKDLRIERNAFIRGGARSINIGGSTGLQYFRPLGINYESSDITVFANVFIESEAPVAFVGTVDSKVYNNTIVKPGKWAIRILQENVEGFLPCGNNSFINNIVYLGNAAANPTINIGPNTSPESFTFSNNLWYNYENPNWSGPNLPVEETGQILGENPRLEILDIKKITLGDNSPAIGKGKPLIGIREISLPFTDYYGNIFNDPPSIGAIEGNPLTSMDESFYIQYPDMQIIAVLSNDEFILNIDETNYYSFFVYDILGNRIITKIKILLEEGKNLFSFEKLTDSGFTLSKVIYFILIKPE